MTPQAEYWRNHLMKALAWGIAVEFVIIGWLAASGDVINLTKNEKKSEVVESDDGKQDDTDTEQGGADPWHDAIGFLVFFPIGHICYQRYVRWIYNDRLAGEELDSTVIPKRTVIRFISVKACLVYAILWFAASG